MMALQILSTVFRVLSTAVRILLTVRRDLSTVRRECLLVLLDNCKTQKKHSWCHEGKCKLMANLTVLSNKVTDLRTLRLESAFMP